jgi:hypothetical protein
LIHSLTSWSALTRFGDVELGALLAIEQGLLMFKAAFAHLKHWAELAKNLLF